MRSHVISRQRMIHPKPRVNAVLFDLGGTLLKTAGIPHVLEAILKHKGINRSLAEITEAWTKTEAELNHRDLTKLLDEYWTQWNMHILSNLRVNKDRLLLSRYIATHWWNFNDPVLYPDAEPTLQKLKQRGLKIGLVTNGLQSDINQILPRTGLRSFFDAVVVIDTLRKMKPDPEVFEYALQALETKPREAVFVGDELEADYRGATGAGLTAYLIDRDGRVHDSSVSKISHLDDLFTLNLIQ